jgi:hypothetical protein
MILIQSYKDIKRGDEFIFLKLTSIEDVENLMKMQESNVASDLENTINHPKPSHLWTQTIIGNTATIRMGLEVDIDETQNKHNEFFEKLSRLAFSQTSNLYRDTLLDDINRRGYTWINAGGGIYAAESIEDNDIVLVSEHEFKKEDMETENLFLEKGSKFLILENDPQLDTWFKDNIDGKYSYLLNLRNCMKNQQLKTYLEEYFYQPYNNSEEKSQKKVFIYTTGSDVKQMDEYINILKGFYQVEIEFVFSGTEYKSAHLDLFRKYSQLNITHNYK